MMATGGWGWGWKLGIASWLAMGGAIAASSDCALAQVTPDGTLGAESSVITPTNNNGIPTNQIGGGATRGANLFHSFEQFSVPTGGAAYFNNALDIQNITSRVTGGSVSNIDGLIRANGTANLFLLNPNGIIFGPNASLNIGGSFLGSTASSLKFEDGTGFSATAPETRPLLTVSVPIDLQFGGGVGSIRNQSVVGLQVKPGKTLALVGGDVALEGGFLTAQQGRIELGSVAGSSVVSLTPTAQGWTLGYEGVQNFRGIHLSQAAFVISGGGDIQVQGRRVSVRDGSLIGVATQESASGVTLIVNASESVELIGTATTADEQQLTSGLRTDTYGSGDAGTLSITTGKLIVRGGASVSTSTYGSGQAGALVVTAYDSVELSGTSPDGQFLSALYAQTEGTGNAGNLIIDTGQLSVQNGAQVSVSSQGSGNAGDLQVAARSIELENLAAFTAESASGEGGNIKLQAQDLLLLRYNSEISATSGSLGNEGNITIDTDLLVALENSDITANAFAGPGANISIAAQGIFGTQTREQLTPESDITATGAVVLVTPDVDPSLGLVALPAELVNVPGLIAAGCSALGENEFTVTGRGGIRPNPGDPLSSDAVNVDLITLNPKVENRSSTPVSTNPTAPAPTQIVEAQGWVVNDLGEVVLTANAPNATPHSPWMTPANCHGS